MKVKVLKNFKCNGVKKSVGEYLSKDDRDKIGEKMGKDLLNKDFLIVEQGQVQDEQDQDDSVDLLSMDKDELLSYAKDLGLDIHGRTGEEKIREEINKHLSE